MRFSLAAAAIVLSTFVSHAFADFPLAPDVVIHAQLEPAQAAIGQPVMVHLVYENQGKDTYWFDEDHLGWFHHSCTVTDADHKVLSDPFERTGLVTINGPFSIHRLAPNDKITVARLLNECVVFSKPGDYTITPAEDPVRTTERGGEGTYRIAKTTSAPRRSQSHHCPRRRTSDLVAEENRPARGPHSHGIH